MFYIAINRNLLEKGSRPDNEYRFIEGVTQSEELSDKLMVYVKQHHHAEVKAMTPKLEQCKTKLDDMNTECSELKQQFKASRDQLEASKLALRDISNEKLLFKRWCDISKCKIETL